MNGGRTGQEMSCFQGLPPRNWVGGTLNERNPQIVKIIPTSFVALLLLATLLSGCVGFVIETPSDKNIENPVPRNSKQIINDTQYNRWACQPTPGSTPSAKKSDYLAIWGEPKKKSVTDKGETWSYGEDGRWCGFWIFAAVAPIPFVLPICETFDHVEFENDIAVRSASRRMVGTGVGVFFYPNPYTLVLPIPFVVKPGLVTQSRPLTILTPGDKNSEKNPPCFADARATAKNAAAVNRPGQPPDDPFGTSGLSERVEPRPIQKPSDDFVNCVASGERQWTYRSKCD